MALPLAIAGGAALAGGLGSALGGLGASKQMNKNISQANQAIGQVRSNLGEQGAQMQGDLSAAYQPFTQNAAQDLGSYRDAIMTGSGLGYQDSPQFGYDLQQQAQQFLDPSMDFQIQQATDALQSSAANQGKLFSGATGQAISDRAQDIAQQSWKDAFQTAMQDRGFQYDAFQDDISRDREAVDFQQRSFDQKLSGLGNLAGMGSQASMNLAGQLSDIQGDVFRGMNEADLAMAANIMSRQDTSPASMFGNFLGGAGSAAASFMPLLGGKGE